MGGLPDEWCPLTSHPLEVTFLTLRILTRSWPKNSKSFWDFPQFGRISQENSSVWRFYRQDVALWAPPGTVLRRSSTAFRRWKNNIRRISRTVSWKMASILALQPWPDICITNRYMIQHDTTIMSSLALWLWTLVCSWYWVEVRILAICSFTRRTMRPSNKFKKRPVQIQSSNQTFNGVVCVCSML